MAFPKIHLYLGEEMVAMGGQDAGADAAGGQESEEEDKEEEV